jgi:hypothetical protein
MWGLSQTLYYPVEVSAPDTNTTESVDELEANEDNEFFFSFFLFFP